jgi:hypothetical protein
MIKRARKNKTLNTNIQLQLVKYQKRFKREMDKCESHAVRQMVAEAWTKPSGVLDLALDTAAALVKGKPGNKKIFSQEMAKHIRMALAQYQSLE